VLPTNFLHKRSYAEHLTSVPCLGFADIRDGPFRASTPIKQRLGWVDRKRHQGNKLYSEKKFAEAAATYKRCTTVLQIGSLRDFYVRN